MSTSQTAKYFGVSPQTVRSWDTKGLIKSYRVNGSSIGNRRFDISSYNGTINLSSNDNDRKNNTNSTLFIHTVPSSTNKGAIYCRVSSSHQKDDLTRQVNYIQSSYPDYEIFKDIASGINFKRKRFLNLIERSIKGEFKEIVVAHKDRFSRFAFDFIEWLLKQYNVKLTILNKDDHKSSEQELAEDLLSIVHVFSCRQNGKRKYSIEKDENKSVDI